MAKTSSFSLGRTAVTATVVVAALGYFVDIFDLLMFSILRVPSLKGLGVASDQLLPLGLYLLNMQMGGMLVGGIFWGVLGDKRGRLSVLFGSIFLYSAANIANGFVTSVEGYALCRLFSGIGLAGELGAGITLVTELMPKESRGIGTTVVATVGVAGAVVAALVGEHMTWQHAYLVGGGLGLALLVLRIAVAESGMFHSIREKKHVRRGDLVSLFSDRKRLGKYLKCIFVGLPIWYAIGILITFAPEFFQVFGGKGVVSGARSVMYCYMGLVAGDFSCGILSQIFKTRKKVLYGYLVWTAISVGIYIFGKPSTELSLYTVCFLIGIAVGYWSVFVTNAAEQFGTNLRATVTTTTPNFIRGSVVPLTWLFNLIKSRSDIVTSAALVGALCLVIAWISLSGLEESFGKDLNYVEPV